MVIRQTGEWFEVCQQTRTKTCNQPENHYEDYDRNRPAQQQRLCGLMDTSGRRLLHKQQPCDLTAILQLLQPYKKRVATIAVESTFNWYWLVDGWQDHGYSRSFLQN